jgi:hypothetical protein
MHSLMKLSSLSVLIIKVGNQKGLRALLRLILSLKMTILMVLSLMTMMHLTTLNVDALIDTNLHINGQAMQITVLRHLFPLGVVALALRNRFKILCTYNGKLLQSSPCIGVLGCEDWLSGQATPMVNYGHLAKSLEIWKTCVHKRNRLVSKTTYFLQTLYPTQDLRLSICPGPAVQ